MSYIWRLHSSISFKLKLPPCWTHYEQYCDHPFYNRVPSADVRVGVGLLVWPHNYKRLLIIAYCESCLIFTCYSRCPHVSPVRFIIHTSFQLLTCRWICYQPRSYNIYIYTHSPVSSFVHCFPAFFSLSLYGFWLIFVVHSFFPSFCLLLSSVYLILSDYLSDCLPLCVAFLKWASYPESFSASESLICSERLQSLMCVAYAAQVFYCSLDNS